MDGAGSVTTLAALLRVVYFRQGPHISGCLQCLQIYEGFLAAQGLHGLHAAFFAAQGLHGLQAAFFTAQGLHGLQAAFFTAQGLHGLQAAFFTAQGLHGLHAAFFAAHGLHAAFHAAFFAAHGLHGLHAAASNIGRCAGAGFMPAATALEIPAPITTAPPISAAYSGLRFRLLAFIKISLN